MAIKIALIGNMNNNFFSLCRYLRDEGLDAHLFLMQEMDHFLPGCDTFDTDYRSYTFQTEWHKYYFFDPNIKKLIQDDLSDYQFLIGCDWSPAYLKLIGRKLDIFFPYGGDLNTFTKTTDNLSLIKQIYRKMTFKWPSNPAGKRASLQEDGIRECGFMIAENASYFDPVINSKFKSVKRGLYSISMVYDIFRNKDAQFLREIEQEPTLQTFNKAIEGYEQVFFSHMRHCWRNVSMEDFSKGNDITIRSFANFLKSGNRKAVLVFFRYGVDVAASEQLIQELGIQDNVAWLPITNRKYILYMLKKTSLVIGGIAQTLYSYGIVQEALAMKVPLVHNFREASKNSGYDYSYSCFHASNEQELTDVMVKVADNDFDREKMVEDSYKWYYDQLVHRFINTVKTEIATKFKQ